MTEPSNGNGARELREAQKAAGDLFLASHLEKHELEQKAADDATSQHGNQHAAERLAVVAALEAERQRDEDHRVAHHAAHIGHEKLHDAFSEAHIQQHQAEQKAREAALTSMDKRLDAMNEFRDQLRDQAASFVRREQLESFIAVYERAHDEVVSLIRMEREERRAAEATHAVTHSDTEGVKKGMGQTTAIIVGAISLVGVILGILVVVINLATAAP